MAEQTVLNFKNILLWKLVFRNSSGNCHEFISVSMAFLTLERITVEAESENPTPGFMHVF